MDKVQNSSFTASVSVLPFCTSKVVMMSLAGRTRNCCISVTPFLFASILVHLKGTQNSSFLFVVPVSLNQWAIGLIFSTDGVSTFLLLENVPLTKGQGMEGDEKLTRVIELSVNSLL